MTSAHDHRPDDPATMRVALSLMRAILNGDPESAAAGTLYAPCQACLAVCMGQLAAALAARMAGDAAFVSEPTRLALLAALDEAQGELGGSAN